MAFQRKCYALANNLPCKLKHWTCFKQNKKVIKNSNILSVTSQASGSFIPQPVISRNFGAFHYTGAIGSNSSIFKNGYNSCSGDILRACAMLPANRHFFTTSSSLCEMEQQSKETDTSKEKLPFHEGMALRLVNENGFLSWCRNSYISTVAGLGMINGSDILMAQGAGFGVLFIAGMNMLWGSGSHISNLIRLRKTTNISRPILFLHISGATFHALLYIFLLLVYAAAFESKRKGQRQHKKGNNFDERGHPWRHSEESDHQRRGFHGREQEKSLDDANKH